MPGNSVKNEQKLIRPGESHNEFIHQNQTQSDQWFVCKWTEAQMLRTKRSMTERAEELHWEKNYPA